MQRHDRVARYQEQSRVADVMAERGDKNAAIRLLSQLREEAAAAGDEDYRAFFAAEVIGYSEGHYASATQRRMEAIGKRGQPGACTDTFLLRQLGNYHGLNGDPGAAIVWYDKALAENPKDSLSHHQAALAELRRGEQAAAFDRMAEAARLEPDRWQGDFVALCNICKKDPQKAWDDLFAAQKVKPAAPAPAAPPLVRWIRPGPAKSNCSRKDRRRTDRDARNGRLHHLASWGP